MDERLLPSIEFEGPLGQFWPLNAVPMEAIIKAIGELLDELRQRGYKEEIIHEMLKNRPVKTTS